MLFSEVIGQERAKKKLTKSVQEGRISHAQLFLGAEGCGKLALALAYSQYIVCENKQGDESCNRCRGCIKAKKLIHPDIHFSYPTVGSKVKSTDFIKEWRAAIAENPYLNVFQWLQQIKAENKQGNINTEECNDIIRKLSFKAYESKFKILLMWRPEFLGLQGNRLLKMIEEPPANTVFILVAENQDLIINTILSRTQTLLLPRLGNEELSVALQAKHKLSEEIAFQVATLSEGNYNAAIGALHNSNQEQQKLLTVWLNACLDKNAVRLQKLADDFARLGREKQKQLLQYSLYFLRQCLQMKVLAPERLGLTKAETQTAERMMQKIQLWELTQLNELFNKNAYYVERNANPRILFLNLSIKIGDLGLRTVGH